MKKHFIVVLAVFFVTACKQPAKKLSDNVDKDIKEMVESTPGINAGTGTFSIEAIEGWTKVDTSINGLKIVLVKSASEGAGDIFMENINVVSEKSGDMKLDDYFKANLASLNNGMPGYEKVSDNEVTINGLDARYLRYNHTYTGSSSEAEAYFLVNDGAGYVITCSAEKGKMAKFKPSFDKVINTFKFN